MNRVVRILAGRLHARLPHDCGIDMADLIQAGNVGLLQAARSFEPERGAPLAGYAKFRIRGEMLDVVRRSAASARVIGHGKGANEDGSDLDNRNPASPECSPQNSFFKRQRAEIIGEEVKRLPPRYRTVVRLRYSREMTLREIGAALSVNESRACQIHQNALSRLRRALLNRGVRELSHL
ncbi:MAG TPA: sigma-70 family RNA polymerase sigma factor [Bryobacteraceae bacterium]|nr:sigma-70 family RNA polymerase sigma factor [Bryobacteraceae bacterium]